MDAIIEDGRMLPPFGSDLHHHPCRRIVSSARNSPVRPGSVMQATVLCAKKEAVASGNVIGNHREFQDLAIQRNQNVQEFRGIAVAGNLTTHHTRFSLGRPCHLRQIPDSNAEWKSKEVIGSIR